VNPAGRRSVAWWRPVVLIAAVALFASACGGPQQVLYAAQSTDRIRQLQTLINTAIGDPALERATWGIAVRSLPRGENLYTSGDGRLLLPASAMKIVTLAAAAERLGWDFTYETRVMARGEVGSGALNGDLVISGTGDPSIDDWTGDATTLFGEWAERLKTLGVTKITGRIIGDDRAFDQARLGAGWAWDDLGASFAAGVGALQFNQNTAQIMLTPGDAVEEPAVVSVRPVYASLRLKSQVTTSTAGRPPIVTVRAAPRSGVVEIHGSVPIRSPAVIRNVSVENPAQYFASALRTALVADGIDVEGPALAVGDIADDVSHLVDASPSRPQSSSSKESLISSEPASRPEPRVLFRHHSAPLSTLAITMMKRSQNLYAESFVKTLGAQLTSTGSTEAGLTAAQQVLEAWGLAPGQVQMADGSGLSRYNLVTARALVHILAHVFADARLRGRFEATLSVAGSDGSLGHRLKGTAAAGRIRAKTGSMQNARTVAGYAQTADGEPLAFAILANNYAVSPLLVDKAADAIMIALAKFRR
jgi:D-alanyl-D-alanine carboxypeptidase/D-alanyl-D-alanine-endopeptidase (penicillin-binding protein 4)